MQSRLSLLSIAGACARHPWRVVSVWGTVFIAAAIVAGLGLSGVLSNEFALTTNDDSVVGLTKLTNSSLTDAIGYSETIVITAPQGTTVDDASFRTHTVNVVGAVRALQGEWEGTAPTAPPDLLALSQQTLTGSYVLNYFEVQDILANPAAAAIAAQSGGMEQVDALVSADRSTLLVPVIFDATPSDIAAYIDLVDLFETDGYVVTTIGNLSINAVYQEVVAEELVHAESIGIPIAIVVLLLVFGSVVAPVVPLLLGLMSVGIALGLVTVIGQFTDLQLFVQNMVTMTGLAIGIDYSLFLVERFREQRRRGFSKQRSIETSAATAGKAVVFSGITLILAMFGVMLVQLNIFFSLALGSIIVVSMAVILTATLVPALLSLVGDRIDWPRKRAAAMEEIDAHNMYQGFWGRITKVVVDRPWVSVIAAVSVLLVLAYPVLDMETGFSRAGQLPPGELTVAYEKLESDFSAGLLSPMRVVFVGERTPEIDAGIDAYREQMLASGDFASVAEPRWDDTSTVAEVEATLAFEGSSQRAYDVVHHLRDDVAPATLGDIDGVRVYVTGQSAGEADMVQHLQGMTPVVFAFVLSLSFLLLMLAFRSIVVPAQALIFNVLSVGASWGIMVSVFSHGVGRDFLGYNESPIIELWLPILMFCVLFGLSMDYHVFIVSRIREHYDLSGDNHESVAVGLRSTGKIITGAAAIMVVVFGAFSQGSMLAIQQLGFGLAVAVFIDATIIRSVLVPSVMTLVGHWNWYLPRWLSWLPDVRVEGDHTLLEHPDGQASTTDVQA